MVKTYNEGDRIEIQIGEHIFTTPPIPPKKEILFHDKKKEDQYWVRQRDLPQIFYDWHDDPHSLGHGVEEDCKKTRYHPDTNILIELSKEDTILLFGNKEEDGIEGFLPREMRRRKEGVWFFNNGEPTYLTGNHYYALQWGAMLGCDNSVEPGSSYGQYYQFQRDGIFYYFEICKTTPNGRGGLLMKPKKTGATQAASLVLANEASTVREKNIRMMSITESLAKESNFSFIKYALGKMPAILLPSRSKQNEGEVVFGPPNSSRNPLKKRKKSDTEYLHTWLCTVPTTKTAFDSFTNYIALIDEFPKIKENTYPEELFLTTIVTVMEGFRRKGTIWAMSYTPEQTDRSFYEARQLYKDSKLKTIKKEGGETQSKLICHTLTVQEGMFGCCDKYGKPILPKIWAAINQEMDDVKHDPIKLQAVKRQYPTNENDPWQEGSREDSLFDNMRIGLQMQELEEMQSMGVFPYEDFNLEYDSDPVKDPKSKKYIFKGDIKYIPVTDDQKRAGAAHGKYKWYDKHWTPEWFLQRHLNKLIIHKKNGLLAPRLDSPFFISIDPTAWKTKKTTGVGSYNAIQAFILPNPELDSALGDRVTNKRLMIEYLYREDKPSETLHAMIKLILYLGCMVQIESNMATWAESLEEMGLGNFLLVIDDETGVLRPWREGAKQHWFTSQKDTIGWYVTTGKEHLGAPVKPEDIDNIKYNKSVAVLSQLARFKIEDTKEFDAAVAYLEGIMGINAWIGWKSAEEQRRSKRGDGSMRQMMGIFGR